MTKRVKKESRLSPQAKKLMSNAQKRYSTNPEKAINYLMSVSPSKFNMYDRQKIGREILRRFESLDVGEAWNETDFDLNEFPQQIEKEYQVEYHFERENKRQKPREIPFGEKGRVERLMSGKYWRLLNQDIATGKKRLEEARKAEEEKDKFNAVRLYLWSARSFEDGGSLDRSIPSYQSALNIVKKYGPKFAKDYSKKYGPSEDEEQSDESKQFLTEKGLTAKIEELETRKNLRDDKKASRLERASKFSSVIGILGGMFFLSFKFTGNVIGNLSPNNTSPLGIGLLAFGLLAGFFWLNNRKNHT